MTTTLICSGVDALGRMQKKACLGIGLAIFLFLSHTPLEEVVTPPTILPAPDTYPGPRDPDTDGYPAGTPVSPPGLLLPAAGLVLAAGASVRRRREEG